ALGCTPTASSGCVRRASAPWPPGDQSMTPWPAWRSHAALASAIAPVPAMPTRKRLVTDSVNFDSALLDDLRPALAVLGNHLAQRRAAAAGVHRPELGKTLFRFGQVAHLDQRRRELFDAGRRHARGCHH